MRYTLFNPLLIKTKVCQLVLSGMAESMQTRQMQLEKQRALLDQKRRNRQQQSGKVMVNQFGVRPTSSKTTRLSSRPVSDREKGLVDQSTLPEESTQIPKEECDYEGPEKLLPATNGIDSAKTTNGNISDSENNDNVTDETVMFSQKTEFKETPPQEPIPDISQKLREMGLSPTMDYDSDNSEDEIVLDEANSSSTGATPTHEPNYLVTPDVNSVLPDTKAPSTKVDNPLQAVVEERMIKNLKDVAFRTPPEGVTVKCRVTRDKQGIDRYMYPTYYLHMEWDEHTKLFLLAGSKRKKARSSYYVISTDPVDLSRDGEGFIAKLRSNFVGTSFVAYGEGSRPTTSPTRNSKSSEEMREELVAIQYDTNILGFKGPRRMNIIIPCMTKEKERMKVLPKTTSETLLERLKSRDLTNLLQLYNKQPVWSEEAQAYVLNFHGRVTQASVKNFQLVHSANEDYVILQFGRISEDVFTMDYSFPICAAQAFAIALSSFDSKLACE